MIFTTQTTRAAFRMSPDVTKINREAVRDETGVASLSAP
ncbi:hypothetical protein SNL152K_8715 [Streptomyces sp. NL15-2K]|nr:hypothetical protein SNL152K_8715 [Streptomyces sp. NL15-2K]